ncbi:MAG TPA: hypothetical protein VFV50_02060 [Bdellovibrionales bacterium]|nr:hypothetical protein [Bdellovibrionales bacterium]
MRALFLTLMLLTSSAMAETSDFFRNTVAVIFVFGQDTDAGQLYEIMNVRPVEVAAGSAKVFTWTNSQHENVFELGCTKANPPASSSCRLTIFGSASGTFVDGARHVARVTVTEKTEVERLTHLLRPMSSANAGLIYHSRDQKLRITKTLQPNGSATFAIEYEDPAL